MFLISCQIVVAGGKSHTAAGFDESLVAGCSPTCWAQLLMEGERFYPKLRWEHRGLVQRRLPWKREGEPSSPKTKRAFLIRQRLFPRLSQEAASNGGCPCRVQSLLTEERQRCAASGQLVFEGNKWLSVLLCFSQFGSKQGFFCL